MANKQSATLSVQGGPNNGTTISLSEGPVLMGLGVDNDVDLYDETVSRRHALIMETEDGYVVRDLNSLNGTFVGSSKVEASERVLSHGDKVHLADSEINFVFRVRGAVRTDRTDEASSSGGSVELGGRLVQRARRLVHQLAEVGAGDDESLGGDGREDQIQEKDAELLGLLESRKGTIVTKEEITRYVWPEQGSGKVPDREILKAVGRLRAEIEEDPRQPAHLITVKGQRYVLL